MLIPAIRSDNKSELRLDCETVFNITSKFSNLVIIVLSVFLLHFARCLPVETMAGLRGKPRLFNPSVQSINKQLTVTSVLKNSFSNELEKSLETGKIVTFSFFIELCRPRFAFFYPDEKIWRGSAKHSVKYDTATREYSITIERNAEKLIKYTDNPEEMMNWVNTLEFVLPDVIEPIKKSREYYVRIWVSADTSPLPGSFTTTTAYSRKFVPNNLVNDEKENALTTDKSGTIETEE